MWFYVIYGTSVSKTVKQDKRGIVSLVNTSHLYTTHLPKDTCTYVDKSYTCIDLPKILSRNRFIKSLNGKLLLKRQRFKLQKLYSSVSFSYKTFICDFSFSLPFYRINFLIHYLHLDLTFSLHYVTFLITWPRSYRFETIRTSATRYQGKRYFTLSNLLKIREVNVLGYYDKRI